MASDTLDYAQLDAGIRETVRLLRSYGYTTTDSGDGTGPGSTPRPWDKRPEGHVVVMLAPGTEPMDEVARGVAAVLRARGLLPVPRPPGGIPGNGEVIVEASYNPAEGVAIIDVSYVLDRSWIAGESADRGDSAVIDLSHVTDEMLGPDPADLRFHAELMDVVERAVAVAVDLPPEQRDSAVLGYVLGTYCGSERMSEHLAALHPERASDRLAEKAGQGDVASRRVSSHLGASENEREPGAS